MSAGCLCWLDKQNTVVAYFTSVPACQAVCGEEGFGSKHNGEFDIVLCFQLFGSTGRGSYRQRDYLVYFLHYKPILKCTEGTDSNIM